MTCIDTVHKSPYFLRTHLVCFLLLRRRKYTPQKSLKQLSFAFVSTTQTCFLVTVQNYSFFDELIRSCLANKPPFCKYLNGCVRKKNSFSSCFHIKCSRWGSQITESRGKTILQGENLPVAPHTSSSSQHWLRRHGTVRHTALNCVLLRNIHDKLLTVHNGDQL